MTETPAKYQPEPREHEQKDRLYELYWGDMASTRDIADEFDVHHNVIRDAMSDLGIPTRVGRYTRSNNVSPFAGFYADQPARTTEKALETGEPDETADFDGWKFVDWKGGAAADD